MTSKSRKYLICWWNQCLIDDGDNLCDWQLSVTDLGMSVRQWAVCVLSGSCIRRSPLCSCRSDRSLRCSPGIRRCLGGDDNTFQQSMFVYHKLVWHIIFLYIWCYMTEKYSDILYIHLLSCHLTNTLGGLLLFCSLWCSSSYCLLKLVASLFNRSPAGSVESVIGGWLRACS